MSELMGRNEYARHRKCSPNAVKKAEEDGRIAKAVVRDSDGTFVGIKWRLADELWVLNTDPDQQLRGNGGVLPAGPAPIEFGRPADQDEELDDDRKELLQHKTVAAKADAQLKTMLALERAGELVDAEAVRREFLELARLTRNSVLGIYDRLAPMCPPHLQKTLFDELRKAVGALSQAIEQRAAAAERETALQ